MQGQTEKRESITSVDNNGETQNLDHVPRLVRDDPAWQGVIGMYADVPDDIYEMYLECIRELREQRDREDAQVDAVK